MFGEVAEPWWDNRDLFIVGGGASLKGYDLSRLHERGRVLGINKAHNPSPGVFIPMDATFSIDHNFIRHWSKSLHKWAQAGQEVYLAVGSSWFSQHPPIPGVRYLERVQGIGVSENMGHIINGCNSGYGGLCLAVMKRARRIFLLGFDMRDENDHWHDGYDWAHRSSTKVYFPRWAAKFSEIRDCLPPHVEVYNCNPESGITAFPFTSYSEVGL